MSDRSFETTPATLDAALREIKRLKRLLKIPRSEPDHRRFFALIAAAHHHWPEHHDFQPTSAEHLRAYLICKAGRYTVNSFELPDVQDPVTFAKMVEFAENLMAKGGDGYSFGRWRGRTLSVYRAQSIAFEAMNQKQFGMLRQEVEDVIKTEIGVDAETLLKQHERAA